MDENVFGKFIFGKLNTLLVDCGVIVYIIIDMFKFIKFDDIFKLDKYFIELVNGIRVNNVVLKRGDVDIIIVDLFGIFVKVILRNVLFILFYF